MITIEDLKKYLRIDSSDTSKDNQLNLAILNANGFLEGFLGYSLELNANKIALFNGKGDCFELKDTNINSVSSIKYGEDEFDENLTSYTGAKKIYEERGLVKTKELIGPYIEIIYSFGYDSTTCPGDLKMALLEIASMTYKNMGEVSMGDLKSESVDGDQVVFKDVTGRISENAVIILNKYKRYDFSA